MTQVGLGRCVQRTRRAPAAIGPAGAASAAGRAASASGAYHTPGLPCRSLFHHRHLVALSLHRWRLSHRQIHVHVVRGSPCSPPPPTQLIWRSSRYRRSCEPQPGQVPARVSRLCPLPSLNALFHVHHQARSTVRCLPLNHSGEMCGAQPTRPPPLAKSTTPQNSNREPFAHPQVTCPRVPRIGQRHE